VAGAGGQAGRVRTIHVPALAIAAGVTLLLAACGSPANPAEKVADTIVAALAPVHPKVVCDNGDAGTGIDNDLPWFTAYLVMDRTPDLDRTVTDAAGTAGVTAAAHPAVVRSGGQVSRVARVTILRPGSRSADPAGS
jgi:hypothetical protein